MGKRLIIPGADFSANAIENEPMSVPFTLQNGYASSSGGQEAALDIDSNAAACEIRVRTNQLAGSYTVKTKTGYVIRAIVTYTTPINITGPNNYYQTTDVVTVSGVQGLTEYELSNENGYSIITFCKTDAMQEISASEDIVDYIVRPEE